MLLLIIVVLVFRLHFFVCPGLWLQFPIHSASSNILGSTCQQLAKDRCKFIHFDPSKCLINFLKNSGVKT